MNFDFGVNGWWYMVLELIRDSISLQVIIWGVIISFLVKNILRYLPELIKELRKRE